VSHARSLSALALTLALAGLPACGSDSLAPFQPEIYSASGTFQLQATGLDNVTTIEEYAWSNAGQSANVNQSSTVTAGSAVLTVIDNTPIQVYSRALDENGTFVTSVGQEGSWTIRLELTNYSGDLNFRVESP